jgi:recombination associated protein RdgC
VDSTSTKRAEEMLSLLRETLGTFKVVPMQVNQAPAAVLTDWLNNVAPRDFDISDECELRETGEEGGSLKCKRLDLASDDIHQHLKAGMQVVKLAVQWREHIECILSEDLTIKRLKFMDILQEEVENTGAEDAASRFDTEFALMNLTLAQFIKSVLEVYGGISEEIGIAA